MTSRYYSFLMFCLLLNTHESKKTITWLWHPPALLILAIGITNVLHCYSYTICLNPGLSVSPFIDHCTRAVSVAVLFTVHYLLEDFQMNCFCPILSNLARNSQILPARQMITQNGMLQTNVYPHLILILMNGDRTVLYNQSPHLNIWARSIKSLSNCHLYSTDFQPSLKRLFHSFVHVMLIEKNQVESHFEYCQVFGNI